MVIKLKGWKSVTPAPWEVEAYVKPIGNYMYYLSREKDNINWKLVEYCFLGNSPIPHVSKAWPIQDGTSDEINQRIDTAIQDTSVKGIELQRRGVVKKEKDSHASSKP